MLEKKLNELLADLVVEYHKLQNFHWYVKGKAFFTTHAKLEEIYDGINASIDEVAENLLMIGGKPLGSLVEFKENSKIEEAKMEYIKTKDIYQAVLKDFDYLLGSIKEIKKLADEKEVYLISILMDDQIKYFSKAIWMIKQVVSE